MQIAPQTGRSSREPTARSRFGSLLRAQKSAGLARLHAFVMSDVRRYLHLTDEALRLAAELWARTRREGRPTSTTLDLDIDVILAAQALTYETGSELVVVTTNTRNLQPCCEQQENRFEESSGMHIRWLLPLPSYRGGSTHCIKGADRAHARISNHDITWC